MVHRWSTAKKQGSEASSLTGAATGDIDLNPQIPGLSHLDWIPNLCRDPEGYHSHGPGLLFFGQPSI